PFVERYALYNWVEDSRRLVWDDGWPRAAGVIYRDKESPIGHRQELKDSDTGRTARYRFDGSLTDDGGNGQDALRVGTPSFVSGRHGQAVQFDGVNDYLQLPESVGNSTDFTFAAWVYWNGGANWQRIFDLGDDTQHYLFLTTKAGSGGGTRFAITTGGGSGEQRLDAATFPTGVWTHVAVTLKGDTGKLFINGAPSATNGSMSLNPDGIGVKFNYLGHSRYAADPNFNGRLDDVRFLTSALTDAQIASLASSAPPAFSAASVAAPNAIVYQPYSATLTTLASGGSGGLTFAKMDGPSWLKISSSGTLSGTPGSADAGVNRFVVRVTDAVGGAELAELTVDVEALAAVPVTVASSISSGANDAEESAAGAVTLDSTDLEMTHDPALAGLQTVALRFSLQVPPGAFIQDARIQFTPDEDQDEATSLTISVEAADQAAAFSTATGNLTGRTRHPVTIPWDPAAWVAGAAGPAHQTPNLAGLVQSTVLRSGWQLGNAMVFIFSGTGQRTAEAFEKSGGTPARLTVTFFTPSTRFTATGTISTSENDAEESAAGVMNLTSTDLELVADGALGNQTVGLRFTPVAIPRNAFISTATVQFAADETQSGVTSLTIQAQAADNAPGFTTASNDLGNRPRTAAASAWSPPPWTVVGDRGSAQMTPNISAVVQEVVSRPGWTSGNALVLLIAGTGHRTAYSFDDTAAQPAELSVRYFNEVPQFTYGRWAVDFADLSGDPAADDDGDSVPNLVEYALGRHPLQPAAPPLFQLVPDAGGTLGFTWNCASNALDVRCDPEWADLPAGPWSTSGTMTRIIADDGMQRTLHTLIPGGSVRRFVRLRVRLP
nr:putative Ig domain-containing protein [Verrucomicrobiales bacterium]